jgi:ribosomal protein S18 acetylase RimI-like enzyme
MPSPTSPNQSEHIRRVESPADLLAVADLIETAFDLKGDPEGQVVIRQMRRVARQRTPATIRALRSSTEGFVWIENGEIVGNITLMHFHKSSKPRILIANVAVAPPYQGLGIATALTDYVMRYLHNKPEAEIWLQVRSDNAQAIHIYSKYGFNFEHTIAQWRYSPAMNTLFRNTAKVTAFHHVSRRRISDWAQQLVWLNATYPEDTRWYQNLNFAAFSPWAWLNPANWIELPNLQHIALRPNGHLAGGLTWQQTATSADQILLALPQSTNEDDSAEVLLRYLIEHLKPTRDLHLEYPAGRATCGIQNAGFVLARNLDWMRFEKPQP